MPKITIVILSEAKDPLNWMASKILRFASAAAKALADKQDDS
jgi:hypothetical protein